MHRLGETRSVLRHDHLLQTPDTFVRTVLPGMTDAEAVVHIAPAAGAAFTQYTAELEPGGTLGPVPAECMRFLYVLAGALECGAAAMRPGSFAYLPAGAETQVTARTKAALAVIEKRYVALDGFPAPGALTGHEEDVPSTALNGDADLQVRTLLAGGAGHDFAVNTMTYQPGAALAQVEIHVMEHGLLMLAGGGIYRLGESWYPVTAGDFIWMAPYCPQWFGAIGKTPAKYLIYKDWNRHPLASGTGAGR